MTEHKNIRKTTNNSQKKRVFIVSKRKEDSLTEEKKPKDKDGSEPLAKFNFKQNPFA